MATQPPPGWYPDPSGKPRNIYWDGRRWVDSPAAFVTPPTVLPRHLTRNRMIAIGAALAVVAAFIVVGFLVLLSHACWGGCSHSKSYQAGYQSAAAGHARTLITDPDHANYDLACSTAYPAHKGFDTKEWTQGCLQAFDNDPPRRGHRSPGYRS
jgi:hypothetical protein